MSFDIGKLAVALHDGLPGFDVQYLMAPPSRSSIVWPEGGYRIGAVVVLLEYREDDWHIILMRRTEDGGTHSGQISFPGGRFEEGDGSFLFTALREMKEEIGVDWNKVRVLGGLSPLYIPPSNYMVYPYVAVAVDEIEYVLSSMEVTELISIPLSRLIHSDSKVNRIVSSSGDPSFEMEVPVYDLDENNFVWGATAMILRELEAVLTTFVK
jgi:8-oxo-dGTP pyrophosphatase MutT (NUDIX family)